MPAVIEVRNAAGAAGAEMRIRFRPSPQIDDKLLAEYAAECGPHLVTQLAVRASCSLPQFLSTSLLI